MGIDLMCAKTKQICFSLCLLICCAPEGYSETRGLMWEIAKDGLRSHLLGSVHFADNSFYPLSSSIMNAYQHSDVLVVEVDEGTLPPSERTALLREYGIYPSGQSLKTQLQPRTLGLIKELLAEHGVSLDAVQNYRPGLLSVSLTGLQAGALGYSAEMGIDSYFIQKARGRKTIRQIETFEFQIHLLARLPSDEEVLHASFMQMKGYERTWQALMEAWKSGDSETIRYEMLEKPLVQHRAMADYLDVLLFSRHPKMLAETERCFHNKERCFIVVGAGHLVGDQGLLSLLQAKGYALKQL